MATVAQERIISSTDTLVKYNNPTLVTQKSEKSSKDSRSKTGSVRAACKVQTTVEKTDLKREAVDILNNILPPKQWEEEGKLWNQEVSSTPATRLDIINLQEQLDMKLQQRQARETGICPVRRELYTQCFDELIREVTINCAEQGLLLLRVRDEIRMTMAAYQTLYQSSIAFGMRKALQAEQGKEDLLASNAEISNKNADLEKTLADFKLKSEQAERRANELREAEEKKHAEELQFLKKTNQQLKTQLEGIIAPKK